MKFAERRRVRAAVEGLEGRRLLSQAGKVDTSFGGGQGFVETSFPYGGFGNAIAVQPDGKIVVAGATAPVDGLADEDIVLALARLNPDGSPDTSFGSGQGKLIVDGAPGASALAIMPDGRIVVAGRQTDAYGSTFVQVNRFEPDGTPDPTFGQAGEASFRFGPGQIAADLVGGLAIEPDGSILVGGSYEGSYTTQEEDVAVGKLTAAGVLDATFGTAGIQLVPVEDEGQIDDSVAGIAIQSDGKIVLAGSVGTSTYQYGLASALVVRLDADGQPDPTVHASSFGVGVQTIDPVTGSGSAVSYGASGVAIQPDGKIVIGGIDDGYLAASRLNPDLTPDLTFGKGGTATLTSLASLNGYETTGGVALAPDGRIGVAAGFAVPDPGTSFQENSQVAGRFTADGAPDATFGDAATPGFASLMLGPQPYTINALAIQADGSFLLAGDSGVENPGSVNAGFTVIRLTGATPVSKQAPGDFLGSGVTPVSVYLANAGEFAYRPPTGPDVIIPFGYALPGQSIPAVGDYDGVGNAELGVYLPSYGVYAYRPASGIDVTTPFGLPGAGQSIPTPADFEGSGKDDVAVYMPSIATYGIRPADGGPDLLEPIGVAGIGQSLPAPADYFGTGQADVAVYVASLGAFAVRPPGGGPDVIVPFGLPGVGQSIPVPGDYDGSGHVELAVYLPSTGQFIYRPYSGGPDIALPVATPGQTLIPSPGDYDGGGRLEFALYDPSDATLTYFRGIGAQAVSVAFGSSGFEASLPTTASPSAIGIETTAPTPAATTTGAVAFLNQAVAAASIPGDFAATSSARVSAASVAVTAGSKTPKLGRPAIVGRTQHPRAAGLRIAQGIPEATTSGR